MSLLPVEEALTRILALGTPLPVEPAPLAACLGRTLAADVAAARVQPAADLSAMDGYAIRFAELPGPWTLAGESTPGRLPDRALAPGEAMRIFTGAPLPAGADTVVVQEEIEAEGTAVRLTGEGPPRPGAHVRPAGSDFAAAAPLLTAGTRLGPAHLALAAMGGHGTLPVRRRARVALLSTGNELVPVGAPTHGLDLPASNAPMLAALLAPHAADAEDRGIVPDRLAPLARAFEEAAGADVLVTTGGASVGDHDLVRPALVQAGAAIDFWRIAMKPGKPLMAGMLDGAIVLGLPGNPVSAFVTARLFLLPLVARMTGEPAPASTRPMTLAAPLPATGIRAEYLRGRTEGDRVAPLSGQDSAGLATLAQADVLIVRPRHAPAARPGDVVDVLPIA
ncbi:molybdopterin molybdotransferase MoeA [Sphingomonas jatrophae]|uniref:Molybdopterin molybdenumtransferase n=1 Tax=Sphingomonas jatrophae TaxID=1166337 RepID=A0A1I6JDH5_9SPHN|nr:molybdopterin molybdotransferase MoeA [Sphingomonas jatrophae]SFR77021.1 molybdopterin molybdochelatase [Sphingomonas jatrophae]